MGISPSGNKIEVMIHDISKAKMNGIKFLYGTISSIRLYPAINTHVH